MIGSRPPSLYRLAFRGSYYDVWQRAPDRANDLIRHESLGAGRQPAEKAPCATVRAIARDARRAGGRIAFAPSGLTEAIVPSRTAMPRGWFADPTDGDVLQARGAGRIEDSVVLAEELSRGDGVRPALERFTGRRYERCKLVVETSLQLSRWEVDPPDDRSLPQQLMGRAFGALSQPL